MKSEHLFHITREKHLDHMVRVVPFIVFCYAIQCYVIYSMAPNGFSTMSLSILGGVLALMIGGFITYDLKHQVIFLEDKLKISFLGSEETIAYADIWEIEVSDPGQSFATLSFKSKHKKFKFYFIDQADLAQAWLEEKKQPKTKAA
jgi:hypothetical protein